jgi:G2/mitotic-specific cyclin-B, other
VNIAPRFTAVRFKLEDLTTVTADRPEAGPRPSRNRSLLYACTYRALGDIGNLGNGLSQKLHVGKDGQVRNRSTNRNRAVQLILHRIRGLGTPAFVRDVSQLTRSLLKFSSQSRSGVLTRRAAAQLAAANSTTNANQQGTDSWGTRPRASLRPRDQNIPVAPPKPSSGSPVMDHIRPQREALPDIDKQDHGDPLAATAFIKHMFDFYRKAEPAARVAPDYMSRQNDINDKMRAILIDWLVDVHLKFKLMPETLYLTVNVIDRFLETKQVNRKHLQLVGVTAMLVASKYEEIWAPEVRDFVYISDRAYNRDQILNMEKIMLNVLRFNLTVPTCHHFAARYMKAAGITENKEAVAYVNYFMELALTEYSMLRFPYSQIAASAVSAACGLVGLDTYPRALARHSRYSASQIDECVAALTSLYRKAPQSKLTAVYKKFSSEKWLNVATNEKLDTRMQLDA